MRTRRRHRPKIARLSLALAAVVAVAGLGIAYAAGLGGRGSAAPRLQSFATGSMSLSDSKGDGAVFTLSNMAPGGTDQGEVTIGNTGTVPGSLTLSAFDRTDAPGANGGMLSEWLDLRVVEVTAGSDTEIYADTLGSMPKQSLGTLAPGNSRTYRFTVSMPDGGPPLSPYAGDNVYQRATASLSYDWTLTEKNAGPPPAIACRTKLGGSSGGNRLIGTSEGDLIHGWGGADVIIAKGGEDCAWGGGGADAIYGGGGRDSLRGGRGVDRIYGGPADDVIYARDLTQDWVDCGHGVDKVIVNRDDQTRNCERLRH